MKRTIMAAILLSLSLCACSSAKQNVPATLPDSPEESTSVAQKETVYPIEIQLGEQVFRAAPISDELAEAMTGVSWKPNDNIQLADLSLLTLSYCGFDGKYYTGQMVAANDAAQDLTAIFQELFDSRFPIETMNLMETYDANDKKAMTANNCSAFCYRVIDGTDALSNHSFGLAVDINPVQNPYVRGNLIEPEEGDGYMDRQNVRPGMIVRDDVCYQAFTDRGWTWGGDWSNPIDYQHFEKPAGES